MIEVEKKFILSPGDEQRLLEGAAFVSEKRIIDAYYDRSDFIITKKDWWLRQRDGKFELKLPLHVGVDRQADQYEEITEERGIMERLGFKVHESLEKVLQREAYEVFCVCHTLRRKYQRDQFVIDFDLVKFKQFTYAIAEIELMVEHQEQIQKATDTILAFARKINLQATPVRGKVIEYLRRVKPDHYQALVAAGVAW